jgi:hypothetical protein
MLTTMEELVDRHLGGGGGGGEIFWGYIPTVFHVETHVIKACIMKNIEKDYTGRNNGILSHSQAAIKALDSFQINSKLFSDCHQSLMEMPEHNRIQLVSVQDTWKLTEIKQLISARQGSSHPLIRPDPVLGVYADVARELMSGWTDRKHEEYLVAHTWTRDFFKKNSAIECGECSI